MCCVVIANVEHWEEIRIAPTVGPSDDVDYEIHR